jgi:hypothetical protein
VAARGCHCNEVPVELLRIALPKGTAALLAGSIKQVDAATARAAADAMRERLEGRPHSDCGEVLGQERLR